LDLGVDDWKVEDWTSSGEMKKPFPFQFATLELSPFNTTTATTTSIDRPTQISRPELQDSY
jgi:hypothetical protein